ncbi:MAG: hypothetical protein OEY97_11710 [Nitrospirota bacterium]|nr:hypothetical protein [Nitrospirota bacterium]
MSSLWSSYYTEFLEVIGEARQLLGVGLAEYLPYSERLGDVTNWPQADDVPDYPAPILNSVRAVFRRAADIISYASTYDSTCNWFEHEDGSLEYDKAADQLDEARVLQFARRSIGFDRQTPDYVVFAALAIDQALDSLQDLLVQCLALSFGCPSDPPWSTAR